MLEYIEDEHLYLYDGVIIPSVTGIINKIFPEKYANVPLNILKKKAEYGSLVHKAIEYLEQGQKFNTNNIYADISIAQYQDLKEENNIQVLEQEQMVCYKGLYAGRFDMIALIGNNKCLCDIKTTAKLDIEAISWQLSLYELAYGKKFDKFYAIWLPKKGQAKLVEIPRINKKILLKTLEEILWK